MKVNGIPMVPHPRPPPRGGGLSVLATLDYTHAPSSAYFTLTAYHVLRFS
jgi:hypothetical protein